MTCSLAFLALSWALAVVPALAAVGGECSVRIQVTDNYGKRVPVRSMQMVGDGFRQEVRQDEAFKVACGHYTLNVSVSGAEPAVVSFEVDQPEQTMTVAMRLGALESTVPRCTISGRISSPVQVSRVRLIQLFGTYAVDVPIPASKTFGFQNLECGIYMLVAMGEKDCLGTQITLVTPGAAPLDLKVNSGSNGCNSLGR